MDTRRFSPTLSESLTNELLSEDHQVRSKAWEGLYVQHFGVIRDFIIKNSGNKADATDVFQDAMVILLRNIRIGNFRMESSIRTYIYGIARHLWLTELARRRKLISVDLTEGTDYEMPQDDQEHLMTVEIVNLLMSDLKDDCKRMLTEFYLNGRSLVELQTIFSVNSIQAVKNKKWRCLGYLIRLFNERSVIKILR